MHLLSQIIYSCKTLYVFSDGLSVHHQELKTVYTPTGICQRAAATCCYREWDGTAVPSHFGTVFPSIIRSSKLRIQQRYMSKSCCYLLLSGMKWNCSSISFRTVFPSIIRSSKLRIHQQVYVKQLLLPAASKQVVVYVWHIPDAVCTVLNSWWWMERLSETCRVLFQNKFEKLVHLVVFIMQIYYDARPYERKISPVLLCPLQISNGLA